jgi:hypothetical protein
MEPFRCRIQNASGGRMRRFPIIFAMMLYLQQQRPPHIGAKA